jgi:hypothetical protein
MYEVTKAHFTIDTLITVNMCLQIFILFPLFAIMVTLLFQTEEDCVQNVQSVMNEWQYMNM